MMNTHMASVLVQVVCVLPVPGVQLAPLLAPQQQSQPKQNAAAEPQRPESPGKAPSHTSPVAAELPPEAAAQAAALAAHIRLKVLGVCDAGKLPRVELHNRSANAVSSTECEGELAVCQEL